MAAERNDFLQPAFRPASLDRAVVRRAALAAIERHAPLLRDTVLDVGCGHQPYRSVLLGGGSGATAYVGLDLPPTIYQAPDIVWDGTAMPVGTGTMGGAVATEVLEHVPHPAPLLCEILRVLRPGSPLLLTVPFLWPLHDVPHDEYRYTPFSLERLLTGAGFENVAIEALGGWDASLAQLLGLWVRRRPMRPRVRRILSVAATPVVRALATRDRPPSAFAESTMITGLAAIAFKPA